jgi:hypothetical protein
MPVASMRAESAHHAFAAPLLIATVTATGLASAPIGDGPWDGLSWLGLAAPAAVAIWKSCVS